MTTPSSRSTHLRRVRALSCSPHCESPQPSRSACAEPARDRFCADLSGAGGKAAIKKLGVGSGALAAPGKGRTSSTVLKIATLPIVLVTHWQSVASGRVRPEARGGARWQANLARRLETPVGGIRKTPMGRPVRPCIWLRFGGVSRLVSSAALEGNALQQAMWCWWTSN